MGWGQLQPASRAARGGRAGPAAFAAAEQALQALQAFPVPIVSNLSSLSRDELVSHHSIIDMQLVSSPRTNHPNSAMQVPQSMLSWKNYPTPAIHHEWTKTTRRHFIWRLTPFLHRQKAARAVESHPLLSPQPNALHTHTYASHFLLPLPSPPFSRPPYFLCIHEISINEKLSRKFCH